MILLYMEIMVTIVSFCNDFVCLHKKSCKYYYLNLLLQEIASSELDSGALGGLIA